MDGEEEQGKRLNNYAGRRAKFEKVDRVRACSDEPESFIFEMKILVVWPDLVGRDLRA